MSGIFSDISNATQGSRSDFIRAGIHRLKVDKLDVFTDRKNRTFYKAEFIILESEGGVTFGKDENGNEESTPSKAVPKHNVGEKVCAMFLLSDPDVPGMENVNNLLSAIANTEPENVEEADADASVSDAQPCKGSEVKCQATAIKTKKNNDFTRLSFYHVG